MNVSELARQAGTVPGTVRFYEREGALPSPRRARNGYRSYDAIDLCRLRTLLTLRGLGLSIAESGPLASQCAAGSCDEMSANLLPRLASRRAEVAAARSELEHLDAELARLESAIQGGEANAAACLERRDADDAALRLPVRA
ncbi:MAG: MerR family transcriptional regulator [Candidatus Limnocylindrales bacterium]